LLQIHLSITTGFHIRNSLIAFTVSAFDARAISARSCIVVVFLEQSKNQKMCDTNNQSKARTENEEERPYLGTNKKKKKKKKKSQASSSTIWQQEKR
jgi:hypothetical protein